MLTGAQKQAILAQDKSTKAGYLASSPSISHAGIKSHPKFTSYTASIGSH
jgi:hypothetical protein